MASGGTAGTVGSSAGTPVDVENAYDLMTDSRRRAKSNDPGWKYGYWTEIGNRDKVTCNLCKTVTTGGIKRLKEHLAGGYADTLMCSKTTTEIRKEMRAYLEKNKRCRPIFLDEEESDPNQDQNNEGESQSASVHQPSSGTAAKKRRAAAAAMHYPPPKAKEASTKEKGGGKIASMLRRTPEEIVDERRSGGSRQTTIEASTKTKADIDYVNKQ